MFPDFCNRRSVHVQSLSLCFDCLPCFDGRGTQIGRSPRCQSAIRRRGDEDKHFVCRLVPKLHHLREGAIVPFLAGVSGTLGAIGQASVSTIVPNWFLGNHIGFDTLIVATGRQLLPVDPGCGRTGLLRRSLLRLPPASRTGIHSSEDGGKLYSWELAWLVHLSRRTAEMAPEVCRAERDSAMENRPAIRKPDRPPNQRGQVMVFGQVLSTK